MLRVLGELKFQESAGLFGKSESWAKVTFYRAKDQLIELMEGKMNISCKIAEDLLPPYLDNRCSEDSRSALEEHLKNCPSCRMKLNRMQSDITDGIHPEQSTPKLASYAKKVRRHRVRAAVFVAFISILSSAVLALGYLTVRDMYMQSSPPMLLRSCTNRRRHAS